MRGREVVQVVLSQIPSARLANAEGKTKGKRKSPRRAGYSLKGEEMAYYCQYCGPGGDLMSDIEVQNDFGGKCPQCGHQDATVIRLRGPHVVVEENRVIGGGHFTIALVDHDREWAVVLGLLGFNTEEEKEKLLLDMEVEFGEFGYGTIPPYPAPLRPAAQWLNILG